VVQDEVELQRLDYVELALEDVLLLVRVHGLVLVDARCARTTESVSASVGQSTARQSSKAK
jgi:hypothetical protein